MNNAEKFKKIFGLYATELWAMPAKDFLEWLNDDVNDISIDDGWIPVTKMLPDDDTDVLITYRYKDGEGDTSHTKIDITSYGYAYFGGNKYNYKEWREPFNFFHANYEVVAWMKLPTAYEEQLDEH